MREAKLVSLDTSVIIEYIDEAGAFHEQAKAVFSAVARGRLRALVPPPVLAETVYVAARVYEAAGAADPLAKAEALARWLCNHPSTLVPKDLELDIEAGKVKQRYRLALTDCYVLASSKLYGSVALFRRREDEMKNAEELRKEFNVLFLEDYA